MISKLAVQFDQINDLSLGTAALLIFGAIASLAVLRGLIRIIWGTTVVCASGVAAFHAWTQVPTWSREAVGKEVPLLSWAIPIVVFLASALLLRQIAKGLFSALRSPNDSAERNRRSPVRWALTLLFSLVPTSVLWFGGATLLRHAGSVAEITAFIQKDSASEETAFLASLKKSIDRALPSGWFNSIDPLATETRIKLTKLIAASENPPPKAIPVLEEPAIRDIILSDPDLRRLAREQRYSEILRDPKLDQLLENDNLQQILAHTDL